jgi:hypothetical protein
MATKMNEQLKEDIPAPLALRDMIEEMAVKELHGPVGGDEEEVDERIRDRYLVGILATQPRIEKSKAGTRGSEKIPEEGDEVIGGEYPPGDELGIEGVGRGNRSGDDGPTELSAPQAKAIFPSSIGMSFCVAPGVESILVTPSWGTYDRVQSEYLQTNTGKPKKIWKRIPCGGAAHEVILEPGSFGPLIADSVFPNAQIKGVIRKRDDHWSVTVFLVNGGIDPPPKTPNRDALWMFQCVMVVEATDGTAIFQKRFNRIDLPGTEESFKQENEMLAMLYRRQIEFAVGHGIAVHAEVDPMDPNRAKKISTRVIPSYEVPKTTPPTVEDADKNPAFAKLQGLVLDMKALTEAKQGQYRSMLEPLVVAYEDWIGLEKKKVNDPDEGLEPFQGAANRTLAGCERTLERIKDGITLLEGNKVVAEAFKFMNHSMWLQRTRSLFSEAIRRGKDVEYEAVDISENRSWYPFQLAFILLNLPGVSQLDHSDRSETEDAMADLLWFPTGGGKTEAYLGLTAFTLAIRRLQGKIGGRSGEDGVAVLMRYTLRLLTLQQFQRATALICACELIRRGHLAKGDTRWGKTPYRIGLWVGAASTPNRTEHAEEALKLSAVSSPRKRQGAVGGSGSPHQLTNCPWCGSKINFSTRHYQIETQQKGRGRTFVYCGDKYGKCVFSRKQASKYGDEGIPIVVVDDEIYRNLPSLLIATVDKFAQMPWKGETQMLFGQVDGYCERHGYRSPDIDDALRHPKTRDGRLGPAKTIPADPLRPPDLIIQDELHLISGPLGTLVGLYETAIDKLCTWEVNGKQVRPKLIASTATIRQAKEQVHALFMRDTNIFPPNGLDVRDNFFSLQRPSTEATPGRKYIGICAPGRRLKLALIRAYVAFLSCGQVVYQKYGEAADPWMTLVGYFNSLRELGGMRRLTDDDVRTRLGKMEDRGLAKRMIYSPDTVKELTSRLGSSAIPETLDRLENIFDPIEEQKRKAVGKSGKGYKDLKPRPLDVLLATNMISVGVDVPRLGLMICSGQPKTTSEYIQATSRIGRRHPGLVVTAYNWARPRDLSHYETFEHYHSTFYQHVEAISVTPFSEGATFRGLAALLTSLLRLQTSKFNKNDAAMLMEKESESESVSESVDWIVKRARVVAGDETAERVREDLEEKVKCWKTRAQLLSGGSRLGYQAKKDGETIALLQKPGIEGWDDFTCLNSLRDVEPTSFLILDDHNLDEQAEFTSRDGGYE